MQTDRPALASSLFSVLLLACGSDAQGSDVGAIDSGPAAQLDSGPTPQLDSGPTAQLDSGPTAPLDAGPTALDSGRPEDAAAETCGCAENTDLVYVLSDVGELWTFDPVTLVFARLTETLGCPGGGDPFSMSISRDGIAYIMLTSRDIYAIDVNDPTTCTDPGYTPEQLGFGYFGMGFASNSAVDPCERLYAHTFNGFGGFTEGPDAGRLGRMNARDLVMSEIGFVDYNGGELSGTGDGRLFAFAGSPAQIIEYNKDTAEVIARAPLALDLTSAFAFAFYGGDFVLFTESDAHPNISKVTLFDHDGDRSLTTVVEEAPIRVVGAAVSTCSPLVR